MGNLKEPIKHLSILFFEKYNSRQKMNVKKKTHILVFHFTLVFEF